jgi:transposase
MKANSAKPALPDLDLSLLNIKEDDVIATKMMMLVEGVYGMGVKHSIKKYGYTEQRYYQLLKDFQKLGSAALVDQKRGPKHKSRRTEQVVQQIIRHRFLDPDASAAVIAQKLNQTGMSASLRSVERTIQEYGLQKKTASVKSKSQ